jgi:hypothetical protein
MLCKTWYHSAVQKCKRAAYMNEDVTLYRTVGNTLLWTGTNMKRESIDGRYESEKRSPTKYTTETSMNECRTKKQKPPWKRDSENRSQSKVDWLWRSEHSRTRLTVWSSRTVTNGWKKLDVFWLTFAFRNIRVWDIYTNVTSYFLRLWTRIEVAGIYPFRNIPYFRNGIRHSSRN